MFKKFKKIGELTLLKKYKEEQYVEHRLIDLFWETTLNCNAKCKHCGSSCKYDAYPDELTTDEIKNAFKQIANDMDATKILINVTGGEPLVRKDLFEVMKYAKSLGFEWGMTTNGILLDDENIQKCKEAGMCTISISIDGLKDTHDEFRGVPGSYEKIIENIKKLKAASFVDHIQVTTVFNKSNIDQLESLYPIMKDLKLDSWRLASIDPIGRANEHTDLMLNKEDFTKLFNFIKEKNKLNELKLSYGCPSFLGLDYEKEVRGHYFFCRTGINVASILYNGDLFVCPNVPRVASLIQGNIKTDNFKDVWDNKYKEFRTSTRTSCTECEKCAYWDYCLGGSFHTWNFEENVQNKCVYKILKGE
ncbi:MAG: radical SAM protein [Clostridia bacterium]|nr:radical SAM protein [Clostridia bacterium]